MSVAKEIHVAGTYLGFQAHLRQRCAWCGALLVDIHVPPEMADSDGNVEVGYFEPGIFVCIPYDEEGGEMWTLDGFNPLVDPVPDVCCMKLDPEVTQ